MVKVEELKAEIKIIEYRYKHSKTERAKYMNWRRLIRLKKELATYCGIVRKENNESCTR